LLIASCLILAIRTAKWPSKLDEKLSNHDLEREIDFSIREDTKRNLKQVKDRAANLADVNRTLTS